VAASSFRIVGGLQGFPHVPYQVAPNGSFQVPDIDPGTNCVLPAHFREPRCFISAGQIARNIALGKIRELI
jgi:hypothetical protein